MDTYDEGRSTDVDLGSRAMLRPCWRWKRCVVSSSAGCSMRMRDRLVGDALKARDYHDLIGIGYSQAMLARAKARCYASLMQADLTAPRSGHRRVRRRHRRHADPGSCRPALSRTHAVRANGILCFTVRAEAWETEPYEEMLAQLIAAGVWAPLSCARVDYIRAEGSRCELCVGRVVS